MRIGVVGTGYVGLVTGACLSEFGVSVVCVDNDAAKIERLRRGDIPIYEPGLGALVETNARAGRLQFSSDVRDASDGADAVFIAVGTPPRNGDGDADLSFVFAAAEEIASTLDHYTLIVTKSTVPVGAGRQVAAVIRKTRPNADFDVVSNPEFLREGSAISDFMRPDRVIIGTESERARTVMREIYRPLYLIETPIVFTSIETAELTKYAANSFLATKITFINELADLCEKIGADVQDVAKGIGLDGRIGRKFLHAGPGFGGSCFPKDCLALVRTGLLAQTPLRIVEAVVQVNEQRRSRMAEKIIDACGGSAAGKTLAVLGLTFKPNTDDMRDSPSVAILCKLAVAGARLRAFDPAGMKEAKSLLPALTCCTDAYDAMTGADALILMTEWNEFRSLNLRRVRDLLKGPTVIDLRNIYRPDQMRAAGLTYVSVGRASVAPSIARVVGLRRRVCVS